MNLSESWRRFAFRRKERLVTTWKFRILLVMCGSLLVSATRGSWIPATAQSLICREDIRPSDLILVDNSDADYLAFEHAANLRKSGMAPRVAVPTQEDPHNPDAANSMFADIAGVMARVAWLGDFDTIPVPEQEPITLNVAYRVKDYVTRRQIRSMIISVPAFRSRRTMLIYEAVMRDAGVSVRCAPIFGRTTTATWTQSWHSIEDVGEQFMKLQYYRFDVLPFLSHHQRPVSTANGAQ